eukprot:Seg4565.3 transcript_id=Seg4565.3/GoldUCD/mRNA.D3Y31 product="hypothetical protein" protein_id=Seg4565.3/GoldUCD/D3Y31
MEDVRMPVPKRALRNKNAIAKSNFPKRKIQRTSCQGTIFSISQEVTTTAGDSIMYEFINEHDAQKELNKHDDDPIADKTATVNYVEPDAVADTSLTGLEALDLVFTANTQKIPDQEEAREKHRTIQQEAIVTPERTYGFAEILDELKVLKSYVKDHAQAVQEQL